MLRGFLAFVVGVAIIGVSWYLVFLQGFEYGVYSLILAPIIAGIIAGRTGIGLVIGFTVNFLLGVAIGLIVLRDISSVQVGSLQSVIGLFGLLGAGIIAVVGGIVGAACGAFGGFVGGHLTPRPKAVLPPASNSLQNTTPLTSAQACTKCHGPIEAGARFCGRCGASL